MSSILKALERVEDETRGETGVPGPEPTPPRRGSFRALWLALGLGALAGAAVAFFWWPGSTGEEPAAATRSMVKAPPTRPRPTPRSTATPQVQPPPQAKPRPAPRAFGELPPEPAPTREPTPPPRPAPKAEPAPLPKPTPKVAMPKTAPPLPATVARAEPPAPAPAPKVEPPVPAPRVKPTPPPPKPKAAAPPKPKPAAAPPVPEPVEIPVLPKLVVASTIWHPDASRRRAVVRVPDRDEPLELKRGDAIGPLVVSAIEPAGVVFRMGDVEIRRRVGQQP